MHFTVIIICCCAETTRAEMKMADITWFVYRGCIRKKNRVWQACMVFRDLKQFLKIPLKISDIGVWNYRLLFTVIIIAVDRQIRLVRNLPVFYIARAAFGKFRHTPTQPGRRVGVGKPPPTRLHTVWKYIIPRRGMMPSGEDLSYLEEVWCHPARTYHTSKRHDTIIAICKITNTK